MTGPGRPRPRTCGRSLFRHPGQGRGRSRGREPGSSPGRSAGLTRARSSQRHHPWMPGPVRHDGTHGTAASTAVLSRHPGRSVAASEKHGSFLPREAQRPLRRRHAEYGLGQPA